MAKRGRPTKLKPEMVEQAFKLCLLGATNESLADFFEVTPQTVGNWLAERGDFFDAVKKGREEADANVGSRLYERAMGYTHPEEKIFCNGGEILRAQTLKHYPPDPTAAIFWLKNRRSDLWRDVKQIDANVTVKPLSREEQLRKARELLDGMGLDASGVGGDAEGDPAG